MPAAAGQWQASFLLQSSDLNASCCRRSREAARNPREALKERTSRGSYRVILDSGKWTAKPIAR